MKNRKVIIVRYLNNNVEYPLSRPHKIQRITEDGKTTYHTMNMSGRWVNGVYCNTIDPKTFVTSWDRNVVPSQAKAKQSATWEYIRIKFIHEDGTFSRPKKIYKITHGDVVSYAPLGVKGTSRRIDPSEFITEWANVGKTPTPKPLRKYCDQSLKDMGYTVEEIRGIRERTFSSKDVKIVSHKLQISSAEARELLIKSNGKKHELYSDIKIPMAEKCPVPKWQRRKLSRSERKKLKIWEDKDKGRQELIRQRHEN